MPLIIDATSRPGWFLPIVVCDACGLRIAHHDDGNYLWLPEEGLPPQLRELAPAIAFVHKGGCDRAFCRAWRPLLWHWAPLGELPLFFAANLELDIEGLRAVNERAALMDRLGRAFAGLQEDAGGG
jgi:hypothetical protein